MDRKGINLKVTVGGFFGTSTPDSSPRVEQIKKVKTWTEKDDGWHCSDGRFQKEKPEGLKKMKVKVIRKIKKVKPVEDPKVEDISLGDPMTDIYFLLKKGLEEKFGTSDISKFTVLFSRDRDLLREQIELLDPTHCCCTHEIVYPRFVQHIETKVIAVIGSCCIKRFKLERRCTDCQTPHRRQSSLCFDCDKPYQIARARAAQKWRGHRFRRW
jgi:hypothetical protein